LLVADFAGHNIFQLQLETGEVRPLLLTKRMQPVWAVAVDPVQNVVYMVVADGIKMLNLSANADEDGFIVYPAQAGELLFYELYTANGQKFITSFYRRVPDTNLLCNLLADELH
jgi:hypothetical protein